MNNSQTMKAAVMTAFGTPSVLSVAEIEKPVPQEGEVLIKIKSAGLNRLDHYIREGGVNPAINFPHVLGSDAVGVIEAVGSKVNQWQVGDRVIPMPGYPHDPADKGASILGLSPSYAIRGLAINGTYAQYMTIPADWVVEDNTNLSFDQAATLPMPLITAVRAVKVVAEVKAGDYVLIQAGASGTGSMMVQVAKALGANVAVSIRTEGKADFVKSIGADFVVNMNDEDYIQKIQTWSDGQGCDVVVDNLGGKSLANSLECIKPLGTVVLMGNVLGLESTIPVRALFFPQKKIVGTMMGNKEDLIWGLQQVTLGKIKPTLDKSYALEDIAQAHQELAAGNTLGNSVISIG